VEPYELDGGGDKDTLLTVECEVVLGHRTEYTVEALVVALDGGPMNHNVIKVDGHTWDPSKDGDYFLEVAGGRA